MRVVDVFAETGVLSLDQLAREILYFDTDDGKVSGWHGKLYTEIDSAGVRPEFFMPWRYNGLAVPHILDLERRGWYPLAGMRMRLAEAGRFDNRHEAYEHLVGDAHPICLVSGGRYWGMLVHEKGSL